MYIIDVHLKNLKTVQSISYTALRKNLSAVMDTVENDHTVFHITRKNHKNMVLVTEEDYNSLQKTLYLLSMPANARELSKSIEEAKAGKLVKINLDD